MSRTTIIEEYYVKPANVPVIDLQLLNSPDDAKRHAAAGLLDAALREGGFAYVCNHSISPERVNQAFEWVRLMTGQKKKKKKRGSSNETGSPDASLLSLPRPKN
jgi:isopenicillin N synthase-like dioxygenase